jgi:hypothetical protein
MVSGRQEEEKGRSKRIMDEGDGALQPCQEAAAAMAEEERQQWMQKLESGSKPDRNLRIRNLESEWRPWGRIRIDREMEMLSVSVFCCCAGTLKRDSEGESISSCSDLV